MTAVRLAPLVAVAVLAAARPCAAAEPARIPGVVVTATRSAILLSEAPAAATLVEREAIDLRDVYRLGDALLEVPGLYVRGSALGESFPSSGVGAISLRGIPRTPRTLVLLDGQPLNNALSGGVIRCIGSTTYKEFRNHFEKDRALLRRYDAPSDHPIPLSSRSRHATA